MEPNYDAFVSYSREDKEFVQRLVKRLERFTPPKALGLPPRHLQIFVDTEDLIGTDYYKAVDEALNGARKLILICSPSARESPYVTDEIRRFLKVPNRTGRDTIPVLLDGIPNNEAKAPEDEAKKAFPEVLYEHTEMPLAVSYLRFDLRRNRYDEGAYANSWFALLANILDVNRDELEEREAKRRRNRRFATVGITTTVIVTLIMLSLIALWQRTEAIDQRQLAYARQLAAQAQLNLTNPTSSPQQGLKEAMASLQLANNREASEALKTGIDRLPPIHVSQLEMDEPDTVWGDLAFSPNGEWVIGASANVIQVWRASSGQGVVRYAVDTQMRLQGFTTDGYRALYVPKKDQDGPTAVSFLVLNFDNVEQKPELQEHRYDRILDVVVAGHGVFALVTDARGKQLSAVDILRNEVLGQLKLQQGVLLGALDAKSGESIVVDTTGTVRRLGYALNTNREDFRLPPGDRGLAILLTSGKPALSQAILGMPMMPWSSAPEPDGGHRDVLITQRKDKGLTVWSLTSGKVIRELSPELASNFRGFIAGGALFLATGAQSGVNLFGLDGQIITTLVHSRAKDWDINLMGKIGRQDPIIDVGASDDGLTLVTARKDGRVSVWRPNLTPRYGAYDGIPRPDMESVAHFDHGEELGETVTWVGPPVLSVSPDGRYIASQSMGIESNPVGGIKKMDPLLRIWDARQRKEIARFRPPGGMAVRFAAKGELLVTISSILDRSKSGAARVQMDVWKLSPYLFEKQRREVNRKSTPPFFAQPYPGFLNTGVVVSPSGQRAVWVGNDLRLRIWDAASDQVAIVDELAPIIERVFVAQSELFDKWSNEHTDQRTPSKQEPPLVSDLLTSWRNTKLPVPPDFPIGMPIAISGNGCCALLAVGTTLRLYDLTSSLSDLAWNFSWARRSDR